MFLLTVIKLSKRCCSLGADRWPFLREMAPILSFNG